MTDAAGAHILAADEGVLRITINRPDVKNALGSTDRLHIVELLERASEDLHVRAVVLTGSGRSFCSGADLRSPTNRSPRPEGAPDVAQGDVGHGIRLYAQRLIVAIMDCEKPVIAAVDGIAAGMGAHIAFACDLIIASDRARFIEVFIRRALVPDRVAPICSLAWSARTRPSSSCSSATTCPPPKPRSSASSTSWFRPTSC